MRRLLRGCVACVRNSRSHTDNLRRVFPWLFVFAFAVAAEAQVQVDLKFKRLQYIAYEPVVATVAITNLAGRDIELHDAGGQSWLGFEITGSEEQPIAPLSGANREPPLRLQAGQRVTRQIDLTPLYPVNEFGAYHVRTNIYFADLGKFFYSGTRVFEVTDARPIWQQTVGVPDGGGASGDVRTYSLMTNRFPDHTSLYVRGTEQRYGSRLCHLLVRPHHLFRAAASRDRSRQSIACLTLRSSARLVVCPHRIERRIADALFVHGNQDATAPRSFRWRRNSRARRHGRSACTEFG